MKTWYSFEHNGTSYSTRNRILSIVDDVVTFEIESKGQFYECLIDLVDIEVLKNRAGLNYGYASVTFPGNVQERFHNVIALRMGLEPQGRVLTVDHENCVKLDNRRSNLRIADRSMQELNKPKCKTRNGKPTTSKFFGVSKHKNYWRSGFKHPTGNVGNCFSTEFKAAIWVTQKMKEIDSERFAKKIAHNEKLLA